MATITPSPTITPAPSLTSTSATSSASCTTAVPGQYGYVPPDACNANYGFDPSFPGNLAFTVLFGLTTLAHLIEAIMLKKRFCWVVIMGGTWELVAFILKTLGTRDQQNQTYSIGGQILFLLAPLWINAFIYMAVARFVYFGLPEKKIWGIRAVRLTLLLVGLDIICFLVQLGGGGLLSGNDPDLVQIGMKIYMAGIGLQLGFIVIFGAMTVHFYRLYYIATGGVMGRMKYFLWALIVVLLLIMTRIIYRLCEFGPGVNSNNPILGHEIYPFLLDATPMVLALVILNVMHPGFILRGPDSDFPRLTRAEKKALKAQKKADKQQKKDDKKQRRAGAQTGKYGLVGGEEEEGIALKVRTDRFEEYSRDGPNRGSSSRF